MPRFSGERKHLFQFDSEQGKGIFSYRTRKPWIGPLLPRSVAGAPLPGRARSAWLSVCFCTFGTEIWALRFLQLIINFSEVLELEICPFPSSLPCNFPFYPQNLVSGSLTRAGLGRG